MVVALKVAGGDRVVITVERHTEAGVANTAKTMSVTGKLRRVIAAAVHYSAAPTQAGVTVVVNSGAGANYDFTCKTGTANAQDTVYLPENDLIILPDDQIDITAPAGGATIIAYITLHTEKYEA